MFQSIFIEKEVIDHPRVHAICGRFPNTPRIICNRYGEVFNKKSQNFREQKSNPGIILAQKFDKHVLETPTGYGIGGSKNFYFSYMLNCPFDCRYCFLQGMYSSAHYVLFVNYEGFHETIRKIISENPQESCYFFSGYDCDSLAMDNVTNFVASFLPLFREYPSACLELRTKSVNIQSLLRMEHLLNVIVAFSMSPPKISEALENRTASIHKRLEAIEKLQKNGWNVGLRFDPLIYCTSFKEDYSALFEMVFKTVNLKQLHSVSMGTFRLPRHNFKNLVKLYPEEKLLSHSLDEDSSLVTYQKPIVDEMVEFIKQELLKYIPENILFYNA